jgi:hypothetical protein
MRWQQQRRRQIGVAMEPNLVYRPGTLIASILLAVLMLPPLLGCAEGDGNAGVKGSDTPQAVVATYRHAFARKDWRTCFLCYDPKMRADFLSHMFYGVAVSRDAELDAIIKKRLSSKFDESAVPDVRQDNRTSKELRVYEALQKQLDDLPEFVDETCRRLDALGQSAFTELGDVRDISIQGDRAVAYWKPSPVKQHGQPPADKRQPVHFRKMDGKWYMTIPDPPPPLSVSERAKQLQDDVESLWILLCCSIPFTAPDESNNSETAQLLAEKQYDQWDKLRKQYGELRMGVRPFVYSSTDPALHLVRLTEAHAKKLIEYLATEGFLQQAVELGKQEVPERDLSENCYTLQVSTQNLQLHEDLGWGPGMLKRLDGLRGALDGEAARAMDAILAGFADDRKKWAATTAQPAPLGSEKQASPLHDMPGVKPGT